jgi:hypothetical protein
MRYGQKLAIARNAKTQRLFVRFDGASVSLCFDSACANHVPAPFTVTKDANCNSTSWYCVSRPAQASYTVTLGTVSSAAPRFISFDALGRPYGDSGTALAGTMTLSVTSGKSSVLVNVDPETGYVR